MEKPPSAKSRCVAFLRAINVNNHFVKMDQLRGLFEQLEYAHVETFIASGNVIFDLPDKNIQELEKEIERHLEQSLRFAVATFIRSTSQVAAIAHYQPFESDDMAAEGNTLYIAFLQNEPTSAAQEKLLTFRTAVDDFHIHEREVYWLCRRTVGASAFSGALLEKALGMPATLRNVTTVKRLAAKYPAAP